MNETNKIIADEEKNLFSFCSYIVNAYGGRSILGIRYAYFFVWKFTIAPTLKLQKVFYNNRLNQPFVIQKHNTELLVTMVRQQFKKNMHETDPEKIQKMKDE
jgi:hypothetical protein